MRWPWAESGGEGIAVVIEENVKVPHVVKLRCDLDASAPGKIERPLLVTVLSPEGIPEVFRIPISGFIKDGAAAHGAQAEQKESGEPASTKGE